MADPKEWGSLLWKIVHVTCQRLGSSTNRIIQTDELLYFKAFQRKLLNIIPCKVCKLHYKNYMINIKDVKYDNLKNYACDYYFNLHNTINKSNNKDLFNKESLQNTYSVSKDDYSSSIVELNKLLTKYVVLRYVSFENVKDFNKSLTLLRKFINF